jgi:hypothetical protein
MSKKRINKIKKLQGLEEKSKLLTRAAEGPPVIKDKDLASLHFLVPKELRRKIKARARAEGQTLRDLLTEVLTLIFGHENE